MGSNKRTIYLGLDYTSFTGGTAEVTRKMGLLDAEFKLAQTQAENYGNETDKLGVKHDYLSQKIALQQQKVDAAKKAYEDATKAENTNEKTLDALQKKVITEATALERMNGDLEKTDEDIKKADKSTESFGDEIRSVAGSLGGTVSPAIEKLASKFDGLTKQVGNCILGVAAIASAFISCSKEAAAWADELLTTSQVTGIATDELQKLEYASKLVDVDVNTMTTSMQKLTKGMSDYRNGTGEAAEAFEKLRIRVTDGNGQLRDANTVYYEAIDALSKIKNETERNALAMRLFGESAQQLNPLIEAGSSKLKELGEEAENLGIVMGEEDVKKLGKLNDAMDKFDSTMDALKNNLGLSLLPLLTNLFSAIAAIPQPVLQTLVILGSVIATIVLVVKAIKSLTDTGKTIKNFFSTFNVSANKTTYIIIGVVAALIALAAIIAVIIGKGDDLNKTMNNISAQTTSMQQTVTGASTSVRNTQRNATGVTEFSGGRTWINEGEPEVIDLPSGSRITPISKTNNNETNVFYVTIDAKNVDDFNRVVNMAKSQQMAVRRT